MLKNMSQDVFISIFFYKNIKIYILGVLYHRWNQFDKAELMYKKALKLNPHLNTAKENLIKLDKIKRRKLNKN